MVGDGPGASAQRDLEERVAVQQHDDGHQKPQRERKVGGRFVGFVEGVRTRKFILVIHQSFLLLGREHTVLTLDVPGFGVVGAPNFGRSLFRKVVVVLELGQISFTAQTPCEMVVVGDEAHVICVYGSKRSKTVTDDGEERYEHVVDHVDDIELTAADVDPS